MIKPALLSDTSGCRSVPAGCGFLFFVVAMPLPLILGPGFLSRCRVCFELMRI